MGGALRIHNTILCFYLMTHAYLTEWHIKKSKITVPFVKLKAWSQAKKLLTVNETISFFLFRLSTSVISISKQCNVH